MLTSRVRSCACLLLVAACAYAPRLSLADQPFRFPELSFPDGPLDMRLEAVEEGGPYALELKTGQVVDLCGVDNASGACLDVMRALTTSHPQHDACSAGDWARKFVARARRSAESLIYWRDGHAILLMTIVMDDAEYSHGFSCGD